MVVDTVAMEPIGSFAERCCGGEVIDVDEFGVTGDVVVVGFSWIEVLDEVIPDAPFPDDCGVICAAGLEFHDFLGPESVIGEHCGVATGGDGFFGGFEFPDYGEDIAIGEGADFVVGALVIIPDAVFPEEVALPIEFLDEAGSAGDEESVAVIGIGGTHEVAIIAEVGGAAGGVGGAPAVDEYSCIVQEERIRGGHGGEERVAGGGFGGGVDESDRGGGGVCCYCQREEGESLEVFHSDHELCGVFRILRRGSSPAY